MMKNIINKIKNFFSYQVMLVKYANAKYEIMKLEDETNRKQIEINEWKIAYENLERRCVNFKEAYRIVNCEREDIKQQCKNLEGEIKKLRREVKRYEKAKIVFNGK